MKIRTLLCLLLRNSIKHTWMKPSLCVKQGIDETGTQRSLFSRGKHNRLDFHSGIKVFCDWFSPLLPQEKQQLLKIWTNLQCTNLSENARSMVVSRENQRVISLYHVTLEYPEYIYQPSSYLGILGVIAWDNKPVFPKTWATRGMRGSLRFTLQHGWLFIKLKLLK